MDEYIRQTFVVETGQAETRLRELGKLIAEMGREVPEHMKALQKQRVLEAELAEDKIKFNKRLLASQEELDIAWGKQQQRIPREIAAYKAAMQGFDARRTGQTLVEAAFGTPASLASVQRSVTGAFDAFRSGLSSTRSMTGEVAGGLQGLLNLPQRIVGEFLSIGNAFIGQQAAMETTTISLAGMIAAGNAPGVSTKQTMRDKKGKLSYFSDPEEEYRRSKGMTEGLIQKMRVHARDLPGEFSDLMNVVQYGGLRGGLKAGQTLDEVERMSARIMAVGKSLNIHSAVAGRDVAMLMDSRAGSHNILWTKLQGYVGMTAQEFNKLAAPEKWAVLDKGLKGFDFAIKDFETSWEAQSSTWEDFMKEIQRNAGKPVFDEMKASLIELNKWYVRNREEILQTARAIGGELAGAVRAVFPMIRSTLEFIVQHREGLMRIAEVWIGSKMLQGATSFFGTPVKGGTTAEQMASLRAGGIGGWLRLGGNALAGGASALMFDKLINGSEKLTGSMDTLNKMVVSASGALAALPGKLGLIGTVIYGLWEAGKWVAHQWQDHKKREARSADFVATTDAVFREYRGATDFSKASIDFATAHGGAGAGRAGPLSKEQARFYDWAKGVSSKAKEWGMLDETGKLTEQSYHTAMEKALGYDVKKFVDGQGNWDKNYNERFQIIRAAVDAVAAADAAEKDKNAPTPAKAQVNITNHNTLHQTLYEAEHPDRIMDSTAEMLEEMITRPLRHGVVIVTR